MKLYRWGNAFEQIAAHTSNIMAPFRKSITKNYTAKIAFPRYLCISPKPGDIVFKHPPTQGVFVFH